ncbi:trimeric intracellular cation channel family protein [Sinimarinibacterium sp. NLF-5-8]|uniref:trimeric intracellular cation channel family protein n=1 Tax=Sinimarinibacterium sp. NLF-5-8 TaxID=2698684 RepID=UPI00137BC008|nr:trimeric intracellular cation channel family protein [Sinimarinibacterium sp. NLF-5-8]QHS08812.1 trimeric intracellular cation channel family protein [Sinimarinibacterium sp. NLF-5-8]
MNTVTLLLWLDLAGVAVFAISGALSAGHKSLDLLGVLVIATVTAIGGGTLRDLLLDRTVFWIAQPDFLITIFIAALVTVVYTRYRRPPDKALLVADALGLALFGISGTRIAELSGYGGLIAVIMGTITGAFGGVLRDVLCAEIPMILRRGNIYATAVIAGASAYVLLQHLGLPRPLPTLIGMAIIALLRLAAIVWNLSLPVFTLPNPK